MSSLQKSGLFYPNKFGLITIKSLEEVMGKNGLNAILNLAGLNYYIENYPPDNLDKGFGLTLRSSRPLAPRWRRCMARAAAAGWRSARDELRFRMP
jgi:hypothetical protein